MILIILYCFIRVLDVVDWEWDIVVFFLFVFVNDVSVLRDGYWVFKFNIN